MAITAIISFTNLFLRPVRMYSSENTTAKCNSCKADQEITVYREPSMGTGQCCHMWIPWVESPTQSEWTKHHITLELGNDGGNTPDRFLYIWQAKRADGDFVRYSTEGWTEPGLPIPGAAKVSADRYTGLTLTFQGSLKLWEPDLSVEIPDFPRTLLDEHHDWHMTRHDGAEFLKFHRKFLSKFHDWYDVQPFRDQSLVAPWQEVPPEFDQPDDERAKAEMAAVRDVSTNLWKYPSELSLGDTIQDGVHNWLHQVPITTVYRDALITNFRTTPLTRHFYQLHGMIDLWWERWQDGRYAVFVGQDPAPVGLQPGQQFTMKVTMRNTGRGDPPPGQLWPAGGTTMLGALNDDPTWGVTRVQLDHEVPPGSETTFTINAVAPAQGGTHDWRWKMIEEGAEWFGEATPPLRIDVALPASQTFVPEVVELGRDAAARAVRSAGLVPKPQGGGNYVVSQKPPAGAQVARGSGVSYMLGRPPGDRSLVGQAKSLVARLVDAFTEGFNSTRRG